MRVHPNDAKLLTARGKVRRGTGDRAGGKGVVATEYDGDLPGLEGSANAGRDIDADLGNGAEVSCTALCTAGGILAKCNGNVPGVLNGVPQFLELVAEVGIANGGRPHIHAAARSAKVHGDADDANGSHGAKATYRGPNVVGHRMAMHDMQPECDGTGISKRAPTSRCLP